MTTDIILQVPSSMILFGEYIITTPKSKALCVAVDKYAKLIINKTSPCPPQSKPTLILHSKFQGTHHTWSSPKECSLYTLALSSFDTYKHLYKKEIVTSLQSSKHTEISNYNIEATVDTQNFFLENKKLGLGSSEATCLLLCSLVAMMHSIDPLSCKLALANHATHTHYIWQGNKGSGYGIYTSLYGGIGFFEHNTTQNTWQALPIPQHIYWYYIKGKNQIKSPDAIFSFNNWKKSHANKYQKLSNQITSLLHKFPNTDNFNLLKTWLDKTRKIGVQLGKNINVDAIIPIDEILSKHNISKKNITYKATGAGNENAIMLSNKPLSIDTSDSITPFNIGKGLICIQ